MIYGKKKLFAAALLVFYANLCYYHQSWMPTSASITSLGCPPLLLLPVLDDHLCQYYQSWMPHICQHYQFWMTTSAIITTL